MSYLTLRILFCSLFCLIYRFYNKEFQKSKFFSQTHVINKALPCDKSYILSKCSTMRLK